MAQSNPNKIAQIRAVGCTLFGSVFCVADDSITFNCDFRVPQRFVICDNQSEISPSRVLYSIIVAGGVNLCEYLFDQRWRLYSV